MSAVQGYHVNKEAMKGIDQFYIISQPKPSVLGTDS